MRNDDFQVLGVERKKRQRYRWLVVMLAVIAIGIAVGLGVYWATSPKTVRTGKRMGDSTIVPELQAVADSLLNAELTLIDGLQGQAIVMEVETGEILAMVGRERKFDGTFQPCENFAYQLAKYIGSYACVMEGKVDAIVMTGGVSNDKDFIENIRKYAGWIAPLIVYGGDFEMEALASGAIRALDGVEETKEYTGVPVWNGFPFEYKD